MSFQADFEIELGNPERLVRVEITHAYAGSHGGFYQPPDPPEVEWIARWEGLDRELNETEHDLYEEQITEACFEYLRTPRF